MTERKRDNMCFHPLIHLPNGHNIQAWARWIPRVQVFYVGDIGPRVWAPMWEASNACVGLTHHITSPVPEVILIEQSFHVPTCFSCKVHLPTGPLASTHSPHCYSINSITTVRETKVKCCLFCVKCPPKPNGPGITTFYVLSLTLLWIRSSQPTLQPPATDLLSSQNGRI